ncbi:MAG: Apolipoprotein N-acyltransferase (EC [uncultured Sulfurovum sp.]|uniref:Apolipoprotein N-acyltransferase (EC) n=1 Tax=uncultured Sulfurovum sp. TaxID=269237 RepID=A0A6S6U806_9BACT|nr:MAG: Apolipoprotein N-acyltransferase (EC [uncultured Sulfurovum sp.]
MSVSIKISDYFTIKNITRGLFIALLSAASLYLDWFGFVNYFVNTILGLLTFYYLLQADKKIWFWFGFFMAMLWFWWLTISFKNYGFAWAIPIGLLFSSLTFAFLFSILASISEYLSKKVFQPYSELLFLSFKALALVLLSNIHPFGFDWYKPELVFTNSYIGIEKWQFALVLSSMILAIYKKQLLYLLLLLTTYPYQTHFQSQTQLSTNIVLSNFQINVLDKWKPELQQKHINMVFETIDDAINKRKSLVILPESIFALYLNKQPILMEALLERSKQINIVLGALYLDETIPRNSTYIFKNGTYSIANKVVLVPFGEANPLPSFMGQWVNQIFFDGAPDYVADEKPIDYQVAGKTFRNAICYEACSEKLYKGSPKNMIVISNNGWVSPSIEPTQQKILLQYYSKKYGTTIYHAVNMSDSYIIQNGAYISVH